MADSGPHPGIFAFLAWAHLCLFFKQQSIADEKEIPRSVYYPMVILTLGILLDNLRLFFGILNGKSGASLRLACLSQFLHMTTVPALLASFATILVALGMWSWVGTLLHILTVPMVVDGLNKYLAEAHDYMEYTEEGGVPRYVVNPVSVLLNYLIFLWYVLHSKGWSTITDATYV